MPPGIRYQAQHGWSVGKSEMLQTRGRCPLRVVSRLSTKPSIKPLELDSHSLEILIVDKANAVIYSDQVDSMQSLPTVPKDISTDTPFGFYDWGGGKSYLTSITAVAEPLDNSPSTLGWKVVVRQPRDAVFSEVWALQAVLAALMVLSVLLFIAFAWALGHFFSRPIKHLAQAAERIAQGDETASLEVSARSVELQQLSLSLVHMSSTLLERKYALEASNRNLEGLVAERTAALEEANQALAVLARKDALTGLPNRLEANERLRQEYLQMKRHGQPYALMMLDIDFFKKVNDTYGHPAGDEVLRQVARLLMQSLRESDFVARVGGEEFLVILPRTELAQAVAVAEKIRTTVQDHTIETVGQVTLSIGVVMASPDQGNEEVAVHEADALLYQAKQGGRNRVSCA